MSSRPKRSVLRRDYEYLNSFGTTDSVVQLSFQQSMDDSGLLNLSFIPEEQEGFGEELGPGAVGPAQSSDIELEITKKYDNFKRIFSEKHDNSDEELKLKVQLLEKKLDALRKHQLRERTRQIEKEVEVISGSISESKESSYNKQKQNKKSGEVINLKLEKDNLTIKDLRKSKKLNKTVAEQLKMVGFDSGENDENLFLLLNLFRLLKKNKLSGINGFPVSDKYNSHKSQNGKSCLKTSNKTEHVKKKKIVTPVSDSDSTMSDSDSDSDFSSVTSSDESSQKRKVRKNAKMKKSGLGSKSTERLKNHSLSRTIIYSLNMSIKI
ncbi:unnamed protein product [Mytilus coruscus]|uniref:Uncharacterized protein n=1 Tax=Mytilus coruscus TaxID=42192 RepID=A0A6J8F0H0_MYTCO|nr:unnamed protein product [Mytilus coruscus]